MSRALNIFICKYSGSALSEQSRNIHTGGEFGDQLLFFSPGVPEIVPSAYCLFCKLSCLSRSFASSTLSPSFVR